MQQQQEATKRQEEARREIEEIRGIVEAERAKAVHEREGVQAERAQFKVERDQLAADRVKFAEGKSALEREMKVVRDMAVELESKAAEIAHLKHQSEKEMVEAAQVAEASRKATHEAAQEKARCNEAERLARASKVMLDKEKADLGAEKEAIRSLKQQAARSAEAARLIEQRLNGQLKQHMATHSALRELDPQNPSYSNVPRGEVSENDPLTDPMAFDLKKPRVTAEDAAGLEIDELAWGKDEARKGRAYLQSQLRFLMELSAGETVADFDASADRENVMFMHDYTFGAAVPESLLGESVMHDEATMKSFATNTTAGGKAGYRPVSMLESTMGSVAPNVGLSSIRSEGARESEEGVEAREARHDGVGAEVSENANGEPEGAGVAGHTTPDGSTMVSLPHRNRLQQSAATLMPSLRATVDVLRLL